MWWACSVRPASDYHAGWRAIGPGVNVGEPNFWAIMHDGSFFGFVLLDQSDHIGR